MSSGPQPIIEVSNLWYSRDGTDILAGVSFEVHCSEIFGIMGMSGAGKTTILRLLMGLVPPHQGEILIDGESIVGLSEVELNRVRAKMGMCFQYAALFDSMTVAENVGFGLRRRRELPEAEIRRRIAEHLEIVGMQGTEDKMPAELSGGMKKRIGVARALIMNPAIMLYDEPTAGLDPILDSVIDDLIVHLRDEFGMTSVVVTHEVDELLAISDRVMMIYQGRIVACDTPEALQQSDNAYVQQFVHGAATGPIKV